MKRQATFVAPQTAPAVALVDDHARRETTASVRAQWLQNFGGGIGAAVLVTAGWLVVHGALVALGFTSQPWPDGARVAVWAGTTGAIVFGVLMLVRSSLDEH